MDQILDVAVTTPPLHHVTKTRVRSTTRKISSPSRNHLKRNSITEADLYGGKEKTVFPTRSMNLPNSKPLKLPPPPVPKKPKMNLNLNTNNGQITSAAPSEENVMKTHIGKNGNLFSPVKSLLPGEPSKKKPEVLPKPVYNRASYMPKQAIADEVVKEMEGLEVNTTTKEQLGVQDQTSKIPLSFSERLRASSLAHRSEHSGQDKSSTKLRSHILSPARRGSRSYMSVDSVQEKEPASKPALSLFKRLSSENQISESVSSADKVQSQHSSKENSLDTKALENLSVQPLSVNSVLLSNSFEDDEEGSKDSFDTKELNFSLHQEVSLESNIGGHKEETPSVIKKPDVAGTPNGTISPMPIPMPHSLELNLKDTSLQHEESPKSLVSDSPESAKFPSSIFFNAKRLKSPSSKDAPNVRRKFRPIGASETVPHSQPLSSKNLMPEKKNVLSSSDENKTDQLESQEDSLKPVCLSSNNDETDSSLEMVTQELDLDSSTDNFDIRRLSKPNYNMASGQDTFDVMEIDDIPVNSMNNYIDLKSPANEKFDTSMLPVEDVKDGKGDKEWQRQSDDANVDCNDTASIFTDGDTLDLDDIISEIGLAMLPTQLPPPPIGVDSGESDDDITLDIIDPPTVYDDEDRDNENFDELGIPWIPDDAIVNNESKNSGNLDPSPREHFSPLEESSISMNTENFVDDTNVTSIPSAEFYKPERIEASRHDRESVLASELASNGKNDLETSRQNASFLSRKFESLSVSSSPEQTGERFIESSNDNKCGEIVSNQKNPKMVPLLPPEAPMFDDESDFDAEENSDDYDLQKPVAPPLLPDAPLFEDETDSENEIDFPDSDIDEFVMPPLFDVESNSENDAAFIGYDEGRISPPQFPPDAPQFYDGESDLEEPETKFHLDAMKHPSDSSLISDFNPTNYDFTISTNEEKNDSAVECFHGDGSLEPYSTSDYSPQMTEDSPTRISEKGRERKRSFQLVSERADKSRIRADDVEVDQSIDKQSVSEFQTMNDLPLADDVVFDSALQNAGGYPAGRKGLQKTKINISVSEDTSVSDVLANDFSNKADDILRHSSSSSYGDVGAPEVPNTKSKLLHSVSNELQFPDRNKLSPASSFEYLPEPRSGRSSSSSMNPSDESPHLVRVRRHLSNRTWSSFNSSSGEEDSNYKKVNIVKLMKERTTSQFDGSVDGVRLSFADDFERVDNSNDHAYETESNQGNLQDESAHKFESSPLDEWTVEDVGDWLEMIGFGELRDQFEEKQVGGLELMAIDFQLLNDMGITNAEDRELILSEIYALKNPEDMDIEMSLLDALDNASGYDREKMLALLEALKMPSEDNDNNYLPPSPSPKLSPRNKKRFGKSKENYRRALSECLPSNDTDDSLNERSKSASPTRNINSQAMSMDAGLSKKTATTDKKKSKKQSFLNAFSFRRKGSRKIARLFSSRKKLVDSSLKYLLQASPQGVVKVLAHKTELESTFVPLLVTVTTTAVEIIKTILEKLEMVEDANIYYLVQAHTSKSVPDVRLEDEECPLVLQCRWPDAERYRFEMKKKCDGSVIIVYGGDGSIEERSVKIETSLSSTCEEIMAIALKKLQKKESASSYSLLPMKNEKNRQTIEESQIPLDAELLTLSKNLAKPAVYRLVRVNFLGSPEGVPVQDSAQLEMIENLQDNLQSLKDQLENANQTIKTKEKEITDIKGHKVETEKSSIDKEKQISNLERLVESLKSQMHQQNELQNSLETSIASAAREEISGKFEEKENEIKLLKDKIGDLENVLYVKEEEIRNATKIPREHENQKQQAKDDEVNMLLAYEQSARIEMLVKENENMKELTEELQNNLDLRDREIENLISAQHESEILSEKLKTTERIMAKKDEQLQDMNIVSEKNEALQERISTLERTVKQKERAEKDALGSQTELMDLRRNIQILQDEITEKDDALENSQQEFVILREKLNEDIELKIKTMQNLMTEAQDLQGQMSLAEQEKKELRLKLREAEITCEERRKQLEELTGVNEEYKGQHQKIKKLERELTLRTDELHQVNNEKAVSAEDLRNHTETLEQSLLDKGSTILNLEFKLQKIERRLKESEDDADEELREKSRLNLALEDLSQKSMELNKRLENYKRLVVEKDKQIQSLKGSFNRNDEKLKIDLNAAQRSLVDKDNLISQMKQKMDEERMELKSHFATLQELAASKEAKWKEKELRIAKEKEDSKSRTTQFETRINEKEATIRKLEAKVAKLEVMGRENMRKFEKFMSDKDRMLKQIKEDAEKDVKALKEKLRIVEDAQTEKERHIRRLSRGSSVEKDVIAVKLKQKEEENKQNKYLLERLMSVVNEQDPDLLEKFESSFDLSPKTQTQSDKQPLLPKVDEDWC